MNEVQLLVAGLLYGGWSSVRVSLGMDRCAGAFALEVTELWPGQDVTRRIRPGDECRLVVNGTPVVTGYVDAVAVGIDGGRHTVNITGRDKAADLVDCSAVGVTGQWRSLKVEAIATALAKPFGVTVTAEVDTGKPLPSFALQEGETAFEAITRAARSAGLLAMSDGVGGVLLTRAGLQRATDALVLGQNVLSGRMQFDVRDRFSTYLVKGQAPGSDYFKGEQAAHITAQVRDTEIARYRPMLMTGEVPGPGGSLVKRAEWERTVRAARSVDVSVVVQGFAQQSGELWKPNRLVQAQIEPLRVDGDFLISVVEFEQGEQGSTTALTLTRPDAFTLEPVAAVATPAQSAANYLVMPGGRR